MASIRLTKDKRLKICENAMNNSMFDKKIAEIEGKIKQLGFAIYFDSVSQEELDEARELDQKTRQTRFYTNCYSLFRDCGDYGFECNLGGMSAYFNFGDKEIKLYRLEEKPIYSGEHEFSKRYLELCSELDKLKDERRKLELEILSILNSVTTVNRLQEVWKESVNFMQGVETDFIGGVNLPTVKIEDINKKLGVE